MSTFCVALHVFPHSAFINILGGGCYHYSQLTDGESEAQRSSYPRFPEAAAKIRTTLCGRHMWACKPPLPASSHVLHEVKDSVFACEVRPGCCGNTLALVTHLSFSFFFFLTSLLDYNCFTMVC